MALPIYLRRQARARRRKTTRVQFETEARRLIGQAIEDLTAEIVSNRGFSDHADYKFRVGEIAGLRRAVELFDEAKSNMEK